MSIGTSTFVDEIERTYENVHDLYAGRGGGVGGGGEGGREGGGGGEGRGGERREKRGGERDKTLCLSFHFTSGNDQLLSQVAFTIFCVCV